MAHNELTARRVRQALAQYSDVIEKRMFGGVAFMLRGHMICGVTGIDLMVRVGPAAYEGALSRPHARLMDFTGKPLRGFVYVGPAGFASADDLADWVDLGVRYVSSLPPKKRSSRKRRT